ncbi:beta-hexosaminidase [Aspergillus karnatakaensis]|uniref:beta-N-acetylhexosaminidase n=1 Tax=Aspergillus karnatakaensis TaxID=1810916 RepID=UPI003CCD250A
MVCLLTLFLFTSIVTAAASYLNGVPSVPFQSDVNQFFPIRSLKRIVVDSSFSNETNTDGATLIPPTLWEFATTFQADISQASRLVLELEEGTEPSPDSIFLTLNKAGVFVDAAGRLTSEGYSLSVNDDGIIVSGASPLGAWWGTRSILQLTQIHGGELPYGSGRDSPGWKTRGIMLDAGRHYYPLDFIIELCSYLSYFKQNELHLHISDNLFVNLETTPTAEIMNKYASFRLSSDNPDLAGLAGPKNELYTFAQFEDLQQRCAQRGVTIIPEIEAPAHALAITRWKPELALSSDPTMLNVSHPNTLPLLKQIWSTFLPWFHSKEVHIGADEYAPEYIQDYTRYVNELTTFIRQASSKRTRIWGTFTPSKGANVSTGVTYQHWAPFHDNAYFDYIKSGYEVINSDYMFYIVGKWSPYFGQRLNKTLIFNADPLSGPFAPHIFDATNSTNNPPRDSPAVVGHISAFWSDWGPTATSYLEAYHSWRDGLPALADKQWGGQLLEGQYDAVIESLRDVIPGQNLDRKVESKSNLVLQYALDTPQRGTKVKDRSGNNYHGTLRGDCHIGKNGLRLSETCQLNTALLTLGRNYTLRLEVHPTSSSPGTLFTGPDSTLVSGTTSENAVTMISGLHPYSLNYTLPVNRWTRVELIGKGESTYLKVSTLSRTGECTARQAFEFLTRIDTHSVAAGGNFTSVWMPMAFEAPLARFGGGFTGYIRHISVWKDR